MIELGILVLLLAICAMLYLIGSLVADIRNHLRGV